MLVAIDEVGRLVVPKALREELGIKGATTLELSACDGRLELTVPDMEAHLAERDGLPVIVPEQPVPTMTVEDVRAAIDRVRR